MIKVGVIGVGYLGQHHARIFSELAGESGEIGLAAVIDTDSERAGEIARKYGCDTFGDYRDAFGKVDAFSIVTPTTMHYEVAMDCIKAGKDILVEKPITATVEEADALIRASESAGVIVQVGHLERFNPVVSALYPLLKAPKFFEAERISPFLGRGIDVDITIDLMIHDIDVVLSILEGVPLNDVRAAGAKVLTGNIDFAKAWLEFEGGVRALFTASRVADGKSRKLTVFQEESYLTVDYQGMEIKKSYRSGGELVHESVPIERKEPLREELRDFVECIGTRNRPKVCAVKGRNALKVALQIGEQIKQRWL